MWVYYIMKAVMEYDYIMVAAVTMTFCEKWFVMQFEAWIVLLSLGSFCNIIKWYDYNIPMQLVALVGKLITAIHDAIL